MSTLSDKLTESKQSGFWVEFQNQLWERVYKARYAELTHLLDNTALNFPYLGHPHQSEIIEESLRNCLQTLLYITWLENSGQNKIILTDNILIDIKESHHVLYWAVRSRGEARVLNDRFDDIAEARIDSEIHTGCVVASSLLPTSAEGRSVLASPGNYSWS